MQDTQYTPNFRGFPSTYTLEFNELGFHGLAIEELRLKTVLFYYRDNGTGKELVNAWDRYKVYLHPNRSAFISLRPSQEDVDEFGTKDLKDYMARGESEFDVAAIVNDKSRRHRGNHMDGFNTALMCEEEVLAQNDHAYLIYPMGSNMKTRTEYLRDVTDVERWDIHTLNQIVACMSGIYGEDAAALSATLYKMAPEELKAQKNSRCSQCEKFDEVITKMSNYGDEKARLDIGLMGRLSLLPKLNCVRIAPTTTPLGDWIGDQDWTYAFLSVGFGVLAFFLGLSTKSK